MPNRRHFVRTLAGAATGMCVAGRDAFFERVSARQAPAPRQVTIAGQRVCASSIFIVIASSTSRMSSKERLRGERRAGAETRSWDRSAWSSWTGRASTFRR